MDTAVPAWKRFLAVVFGSKKNIIALASLVVLFARPYLAKVGIEITVEEMVAWITIAVTLIIGHGLADHGKEAAKVNATARAADPPAAPIQVVTVTEPPAGSSPPVTEER